MPQKLLIFLNMESIKNNSKEYSARSNRIKIVLENICLTEDEEVIDG